MSEEINMYDDKKNGKKRNPIIVQIIALLITVSYPVYILFKASILAGIIISPIIIAFSIYKMIKEKDYLFNIFICNWIIFMSGVFIDTYKVVNGIVQLSIEFMWVYIFLFIIFVIFVFFPLALGNT
ncbi:hypothetical protein FACS1894106_5320 [Spirochaetia bacterium]|nr:hypothetical protein FACS1894106_5320 [Spirochaetia bacterium]